MLWWKIPCTLFPFLRAFCEVINICKSFLFYYTERIVKIPLICFWGIVLPRQPIHFEAWTEKKKLEWIKGLCQVTSWYIKEKQWNGQNGDGNKIQFTITKVLLFCLFLFLTPLLNFLAPKSKTKQSNDS